MIKKYPIESFIERLYCDYCETEMEADSIKLMSDPPIIPHTCPNCEYKIDVRNDRFPKIGYREIGEEHVS